MSKKLSALILILFPIAVLAAAPLRTDVVKAFKYYKNVTPSISIPSVVEVPFSQSSFSVPFFAVYNLTTSSFEPYMLSVVSEETKSRIEAVGGVGSPATLNDGDYSTYVEFPLTGNSGKAEITFVFDKPITSSSLSFALDNYVAMPQSVSISASVAGGDHVVLAPVRPTQGNILFPKTTSSLWHVTFDYVQPLRISEMKFTDSSLQPVARSLRFLAQPKENYQIYFDADRYVNTATKEAGDLFSGSGVVYYNGGIAISNPEYKPIDSDLDSVIDLSDNCTSTANPDQKDSDRNGRGDACEDYDRDGIVNAKDNCPDVPNAAQIDTEKDGIGDACDNLDNRVTERLPWLPWVGIGLAAVVILGLFVLVLRHKKVE